MMAGKLLLKKGDSSYLREMAKKMYDVTNLCKLKYYLKFWNRGVSAALQNAL